MNKMAKGALATGVGVALLLGGGGTLAVWNQTQSANAGQIAAGDLQLTIKKAGEWKNAYGTVVDLDPTNNVADYTVVPGDILTYSQIMDVKLTGDQMKAKLTLDGSFSNGGFGPNDVTIGEVVVKEDKAGATQILGQQLTPANSGTVVASASFTFKNVDARKSAEAVADLRGMSFKLEQQAVPAVTPAATPAPTTK